MSLTEIELNGTLEEIKVLLERSDWLVEQLVEEGTLLEESVNIKSPEKNLKDIEALLRLKRESLDIKTITAQLDAFKEILDLLESRKDLDIDDLYLNDGKTKLMIAAEKGQILLTSLILTLVPNLDQTNGSKIGPDGEKIPGDTALDFAKEFGDEDLINLLETAAKEMYKDDLTSSDNDSDEDEDYVVSTLSAWGLHNSDSDGEVSDDEEKDSPSPASKKM